MTRSCANEYRVQNRREIKQYFSIKTKTGNFLFVGNNQSGVYYGKSHNSLNAIRVDNKHTFCGLGHGQKYESEYHVAL